MVNIKAVILLRGVASYVRELQETDIRYDARHIAYVKNTETTLSMFFSPMNHNWDAFHTFRTALKNIEQGATGKLFIASTLRFLESTLPLSHVDTSFGLIKIICGEFSLSEGLGEKKQWDELLHLLIHNNGDIYEVFEKIHDNTLDHSDFYTKISGDSFKSWLFFIKLKHNLQNIKNTYLAYVIENTFKCDEMATNVLNMICCIDPNDNNFWNLYKERKRLIKGFPEACYAEHVMQSRRYLEKSFFYLTDNTEVERNEIINIITQYDIPPYLKSIYPLLHHYAKHYVFNNTDFPDILTEYFTKYKQQKLYNRLDPDFLKKVEDLAHKRIYNRLVSREEIFEKINKDNALLCWVDALGVEYLSLLAELVQQQGLVMKTYVAQANLPSITSFNKGFYDDWQGDKQKISELDAVKHKYDGGYDFSREHRPIHLAKELEILSKLIERIAVELSSKKFERVIIASDHGASRLAVLRKQEEKYETDTKGEHSGRCCKFFAPAELPFAAHENGYLVLADYGRFKGSRAANVEVHGGASLEEVIVPILEISLDKYPLDIRIQLIEEKVLVDYRLGAEITIHISHEFELPSVLFQEKKYTLKKLSENIYTVKIPTMKRAGEYLLEFFSAERSIASLSIVAQGKSAAINASFDDLL